MANTTALANLGSTTLSPSLSLSQTTGIYCQTLTPSCDFSTHLVTRSDGVCVVVDSSSLSVITTLSPANATHVLSASCSPSSPALIALSVDNTVQIWDIRVSSLSNKSVSSLLLPPWKPPKGYSDAAFLAAGQTAFGTDWGAGGDLIAIAAADSNVYLWDPRRGEVPAYVYADAHSDVDPVLHARFVPGSESLLVTAGDDGVICLFDGSNGWDEDDALMAMLSQGDAIADIGFFGPSSEYLWLATGGQGLALWSLEEAESLVSVKDARGALSDAAGGRPVDVLVGAYYEPVQERLYVLAGDNSGSSFLTHVNIDSLDIVHSLDGGHCDRIRALSYAPATSNLFTIGEDGLIVAWGSTPLVNHTPNILSSSSSTSTSRPPPPSMASSSSSLAQQVSSLMSAAGQDDFHTRKKKKNRKHHSRGPPGPSDMQLAPSSPPTTTSPSRRKSKTQSKHSRHTRDAPY